MIKIFFDQKLKIYKLFPTLKKLFWLKIAIRALVRVKGVARVKWVVRVKGVVRVRGVVRVKGWLG